MVSPEGASALCPGAQAAVRIPRAGTGSAGNEGHTAPRQEPATSFPPPAAVAREGSEARDGRGTYHRRCTLPPRKGTARGYGGEAREELQVSDDKNQQLMEQIGTAVAAKNELEAKLEQIEEEKRQAELDAATGGKVDRGWGSQIRSYVFYDNRVKDHRTGYEIGNPQTVLDGDLDGFIDAELKRRRSEKD